MTPYGRAFVIQRLFDAPDLPALQRVWESLGDEYKRNETVQEVKDRMKESLRE